jgi:hypothetical protein
MLTIKFTIYGKPNTEFSVPVNIILETPDSYTHLEFDATRASELMPKFYPLNFDEDDYENNYDIAERAEFIQECLVYAYTEGDHTGYVFVDEDDNYIGESQYYLDGKIITSLELRDYVAFLESKLI